VAKSGFVNVGIHVQGRVIDLRLPSLVTKVRLKRVLTEALATAKVHLPVGFDLRFVGKPLEVSEVALLDVYAIGDGDQIEIVLKGRAK
jgi:uncharacterized ubiquitin-like protein YukD